VYTTNMKNTDQLINNIIGQLNGVKKMMGEEQDCFKVLTQIKAARSAFNSLTNKYLRENFKACLQKCKDKQSKDELCNKFFNEITK